MLFAVERPQAAVVNRLEFRFGQQSGLEIRDRMRIRHGLQENADGRTQHPQDVQQDEKRKENGQHRIEHRPVDEHEDHAGDKDGQPSEQVINQVQPIAFAFSVPLFLRRHAATPFTSTPRIASQNMPCAWGIWGDHSRGTASSRMKTDPAIRTKLLSSAPSKEKRW